MEPTPVKPSYKTMEFYLTVAGSALSFLVTLGVLTLEDSQTIGKAIADAIVAVGGLVGAVTVLWRFMESRTRVKEANQDAVAAHAEMKIAMMHQYSPLQSASASATRMGIVALLIGVFCIGSVNAQTITAVDVTNLQDGKYLLTKNGEAVAINPINLIQPSGTPTNPPPGNLNPFGQEVARLTRLALQNGGTETTAAGISAVYSLVSDSLGKGDISPADSFTAINMGVAKILSLQSDRAAWDNFKTGLSDMFDVVRREGTLNGPDRQPDPAKYKAVFAEVAKGMNSVTGFNGSLTKPDQAFKTGEGILGNIDIAKIMEWIKLIIELFKMFKPT